MEVRVSKSKRQFESVDSYPIAPTGEYEPSINIDSDNRISIGLIPPTDSGKASIHFVFGRAVSNKLIRMIQRLGIRGYGGED